jgi:hypothetical protein
MVDSLLAAQVAAVSLGLGLSAALAAEAEMVWLLFIRGNQYGSI